MGFNVAFALTNYDGSQEVVADPDYGTLVARTVSWGTSEEDQNKLLYTNLATHHCTYEELGLDDYDDNQNEVKISLTEEEANPNSKPFFFPPDEENIHYYKDYYKKFLCLDDRV